MNTARLFKLGNAQAVRIPARYRFQVDEVEITREGDALILRPKVRSAADVFARARSIAGDAWADFETPDRSGRARSVPSLD